MPCLPLPPLKEWELAPWTKVVENPICNNFCSRTNVPFENGSHAFVLPITSRSQAKFRLNQYVKVLMCMQLCMQSRMQPCMQPYADVHICRVCRACRAMQSVCRHTHGVYAERMQRMQPGLCACLAVLIKIQTNQCWPSGHGNAVVWTTEDSHTMFMCLVTLKR